MCFTETGEVDGRRLELGVNRWKGGKKAESINYVPYLGMILQKHRFSNLAILISIQFLSRFLERRSPSEMLTVSIKFISATRYRLHKIYPEIKRTKKCIKWGGEYHFKI